MLKKGLLQRRRTREDARAYAVRLTDEGLRVLSAARPKVEAVDARIVKTLSQEQQTTLVEDLRTIVASLQARPGDTG
jgi:DNA-binding MarR family transcriptional regulator